MLPMGSVGMGMGPRQFENGISLGGVERRPYFQEPNHGNTRKGLSPSGCGPHTPLCGVPCTDPTAQALLSMICRGGRRARVVKSQYDGLAVR